MVVRLFGITGKKQCGKSEAAKIFRRNNIPIINIDNLYLEMFRPGNSIHKEIILYFKDSFLLENGNIDFENISLAICKDEYIKKILDDTIEEEICLFMRNLINAFETYKIDIVGIESGNIIDTKISSYLSKIIIIDSNLQNRINRMKYKFDKQIIEKIIKMEEEKDWDYDFIIPNNKTIAELIGETNKIINKVILSFGD